MSNTHDYTNRSWGHDYNIMSIENEGFNIKMCGWGNGISNGDYIIIKNGSSTTRYVFDSIEYFDNPSDMWNGSLTFKPRE